MPASDIISGTVRAPLMDFNADHFSLFGLPRTFRLDAHGLDARFREIQAQVHPDRFAQAGETERRYSLQWATRVNEAYQTLKKPLARAQYLLLLDGQDLKAENNTALSGAFLMEQMDWREAVAEARERGDQTALEDLHRQVRAQMTERHEELARLFDEMHDGATAAERVRQLMFLEKLMADIEESLAALEG